MNAPVSSPAQNLPSHTLAWRDDGLNRQDFIAAGQAWCPAAQLALDHVALLSQRESFTA